MVTICSQPDNIYFHWQNLIQFYNFKKLGILKDHRAVFLVSQGKSPSKFVLEFKKQYPKNVFIYMDDRVQKHYIPTIKIHGVVKYLTTDRKQQDLMLIDSDIIINEKIDYSKFTENNTVYCSNTKGYLGYQYLKTKGDEIVTDMCHFMGITLDDVKDQNDNSGGAQLYYKGVDGLLEYFKEVEDKAPKLYDLMVKHPTYNDYKPTIQAWTSEMWAVLWLLWKRDVKTEIHSELDFRWATDDISLWKTNKILHMAGVTAGMKDVFFKGGFITKAPFNANFDYIRENSITNIYIEEIEELKKDQSFKNLIELL